MAVMFDGVDKLQHQAWLYVDPKQQSGELSDYHKRMRRLCLDYFRQLDGFIEELVAPPAPRSGVPRLRPRLHRHHRGRAHQRLLHEKGC
jgi:hypothetical protein